MANKRIKKKLRKRFGIFHYLPKHTTIYITSFENGNKNCIFYPAQGLSIPSVKRIIHKLKDEDIKEIKELGNFDILPLFSGDKIVSVGLCKKDMY